MGLWRLPFVCVPLRKLERTPAALVFRDAARLARRTWRSRQSYIREVQGRRRGKAAGAINAGRWQDWQEQLPDLSEGGVIARRCGLRNGDGKAVHLPASLGPVWRNTWNCWHLSEQYRSTPENAVCIEGYAPPSTRVLKNS